MEPFRYVWKMVICSLVMKRLLLNVDNVSTSLGVSVLCR